MSKGPKPSDIPEDQENRERIFGERALKPGEHVRYLSAEEMSGDTVEVTVKDTDSD